MLSQMVDTVYIVDNSPNPWYLERLKRLCETYSIKAVLHHESVEEGEYRF